MKQDALRYFTEIDLTMVALVIFFLAFCFLIFRVYFYDRKEKFDQLSRIPLTDDREGPQHG